MITNQEIRVIQKMMKRTREKTDRIAEHKFGSEVTEEQKAAIAAQNVLRDCMTVIFNECTPYSEAFPIDLAVRLASYAISNLPVEKQDVAAHLVGKNLPVVHATRLKQGIFLQSTWETDGVQHKNVPGKEDIN